MFVTLLGCDDFSELQGPSYSATALELAQLNARRDAQMRRNAVRGAAMGAIAGAVLDSDDPARGLLIGAVLGGVAGAAVGSAEHKEEVAAYISRNKRQEELLLTTVSSKLILERQPRPINELNQLLLTLRDISRDSKERTTKLGEISKAEKASFSLGPIEGLQTELDQEIVTLEKRVASCAAEDGSGQRETSDERRGIDLGPLCPAIQQ